ncbi:broad-complex core protein isoforms 1/2/3/4/5 isoform X1 [Diachasma alloeum]|uniref:broad-complex core protein isoforms 1/2/3/4/5 isoform X1 n=1 Tax=Diachasma alloeum TaxID=454923 RepID=UPI0007381FE8|nr:broad-complex core protein isoforms 1/2/3/4/5 isoform X1 [Diachasma alloeum]XP_015120117.1 broad-complex core protein isoforms 1/2/3/4/5 isoform X1 [Diachasma alloeum]XP_015120126.1 broad-complex core protein isoforms 1/2/3/4/5 isoform X1 [Diachasma alloeum]
MVDTQHFCLRWNNYQSSITSAFENLRDDEDFVDVTLACDGKSLKAHRVVLSACSPYFRELLKSTPCKHPVIVLQDVAFSDLHALVEFIYHGEVNVHQRSLSSFLKTAEVLRVSGLTQQADATERDELSQVRALAARTNHVSPHEKLSDEGFPRGGSPPTPATPTPTTVQQLLRRAQIRRNERRSPDLHDESIKRSRLPSPPLNNNDATPTDFSMVKNHFSAKVEGNGLPDEHSRIEENIKCEPLELTGGNGGTGGHNEDSSDSGAAASDRPPASASSNEHEHEPPEHPSTPNFLPESKLFTSTPGSFNFSMAALTTDHSPLSVKFPGLPHGLQTPDLAGTSQDREDGGWPSNITTSTCERQRDCNGASHSDTLPRVNQDLPIIDLLDDVDDQIEFKSEPLSPKIDALSCLLSDETNLTKECTTLINNYECQQNEDIRETDNGRNDRDMRQRVGTYCTFCHKSFSRAWSLQRHLADTHFYVPQSLACDQCGRSYKSRNSLISHKSQYHAKKERKDHETNYLHELTY